MPISKEQLKDVGTICQALCSFQNGYKEDLERIKIVFLKDYEILKKHANDIKKGPGRRPTAQAKFKPSPSLTAITEEKGESDTAQSAARPRRKAANRAVTQNSILLGKRNKRKSPSSPCDEPLTKTIRKEVTFTDAAPGTPKKNKKEVINCTVVVHKLPGKSSSIQLAGKSSSIHSEDAVSSTPIKDKSIHNGDTIPKSSEINKNNNFPQVSVTINSNKSKLKAVPSPKPISQEGNNGEAVVSQLLTSKINASSTGSRNQSPAAQKRSLRSSKSDGVTVTTQLEKNEVQVEVEKNKEESPKPADHPVKESPRPEIKSKKNDSMKRPASVKETTSSEPTESSDEQSSKSKKLKKDTLPTEFTPMSASSEHATSSEGPPSKSKVVKSTKEDIITSVSSSESENSSEEQPPKSKKLTKKKSTKEKPILSTSDEESTPGKKRVTRTKSANNDKQATNNDRLPSSAESNTPKIPNPEKRITRSKITKPKEVVAEAPQSSSSGDVSAPEPKRPRSKPIQKVVSQVDTDSGNTEDNSSPEKRITRSKAPKQKPKTDSENGTSEETAEKRCTRSKMASKQKQNNIVIEIEDSDEESDSKKDKPVTQGKRMLQPSTKIKQVINELFSPAVPLMEKENHLGYKFMSSEKKQGKYTPLQVRNGFVTPLGKTRIPTISSASKSKTFLEITEKKKKEVEAIRKRLKEEEAIKKKQEIMKAKQEDIRRKNEEKMQKVAAVREAASKEKSEWLLKMEKEREEKEKAAREMLEKKKEEELAKRKLAHEAKVLEAESRRLKEEAARQAKYKEMEEEQRKEEEIRLKQQEEMEKIKKQRLEEMRMKEAALKARELQKKKVNTAVKDKDNYDINDIEAGDTEDSDDDESANAKKDIPAWARKGEERRKQEIIQSFVSMDHITRYFACPSKTPDLAEFFGKVTMKRVRTSSAVWLDTPPLKSA